MEAFLKSRPFISCRFELISLIPLHMVLLRNELAHHLRPRRLFTKRT